MPFALESLGVLGRIDPSAGVSPRSKPRLFPSLLGDFNDEELKEYQILKLALDAGIIVKNVYNVLDGALKKRNASAHPNNVIIDAAVLDGFISDVINNAVLKI